MKFAKLLGYFSITRSLEDLISKKDQFIRFGLLAWFIIIIIIVMITLWYQSSLTRPIQELMKVSERISINGLKLIRNNYKILTHCNTGALATTGPGTALGIIDYANKKFENIQ